LHLGRIGGVQSGEEKAAAPDHAKTGTQPIILSGDKKSAEEHASKKKKTKKKDGGTSSAVWGREKCSRRKERGQYNPITIKNFR